MKKMSLSGDRNGKSKGLAYLTKGVDNADVPLDERTFHIEDGNASFYTMKEVPGTFRQIAHKVFDQTTSGRSNVLFSTDMYKEQEIWANAHETRDSISLISAKIHS